MSTDTRVQGRPHDKKALVEADRPELRLVATIDLNHADDVAAALENLADAVRDRGREETSLRPDGGRTTRVGHWLKDDCDVYAGRGTNNRHLLNVGYPGSKGWLGNPFTTEEFSRDGAIRRFQKVFESKLEADPEFRDAIASLHGKTLGCWCQRLDEHTPSCHAEIIADAADRLATNEPVRTDGGQLEQLCAYCRQPMPDDVRDCPDHYGNCTPDHNGGISG